MRSITSARAPGAVGKYELLERIGEDGTGPIHKARHRDTGAAAAVRIITADRSGLTGLRNRLVLGFQSAVRLDHPNIIRALDLAFDASAAYVVTEWLEGCTLADLILGASRLAEGPAVRLITQAAQGLHYAHCRRVIHRDVRPAQIWVLPDGRAKVAGFWFGKDLAAGRGPGGRDAGTSDDHLLLGIVGDVGGLAATLSVAIGGPSDGRPVRGGPTLSRSVEEAILKATDPDLDNRPTSCLQFARLLPAGGHWDGGGRKAPPRVERRSEPRKRCTLGVVCTVEEDLAVGDQEEEVWPGAVRDVSTHGVGLLLARRFEPGTVLKVEVDGVAGSLRSVTAKVANVRTETDGHWFHGCAFSRPLTGQQLRSLVTAGGSEPDRPSDPGSQFGNTPAPAITPPAARPAGRTGRPGAAGGTG
jgi:hypothetical protein